MHETQKNSQQPEKDSAQKAGEVCDAVVCDRGDAAFERGHQQLAKALCDEYLPGRYKLQVIDIYQKPKVVMEAGIIAAPTMVKSFPLPLRRFIGDMSNKANLLVGLDLDAANAAPPAKKTAEGINGRTSGCQQADGAGDVRVANPPD